MNILNLLSKKMCFKTNIITLCLMVLSVTASSQEVLTGFSRGQVNANPSSKSVRAANSCQLPFFDDFTRSGIYPDASLWADSNVFVNDGFSVFPPNYRVATFDVLNAYGEVYNYAGSNPFVADFLTSQAIRLDSVFTPTPHKLSPSDSVYFSFYFQPQGCSDSPEINDSLVLEFGYDLNGEISWKHVWSSAGLSLEAFRTDSLSADSAYFRPVMIAITDTVFFQKKFYVRFSNYGSLISDMYPSSRGNVDIWNIDLVYLDAYRSFNDFSFPMVSYTQALPSMLKRYQAMPYRQYCNNPTSAIAPEFKAFVTNTDNLSHQVTCDYLVNQIGGIQTFSSENPQTFVLAPYTQNPIDSVNFEPSLFVIDETIDTMSFELKYIIRDTTSTPQLSDTLIRKQFFYDYFSYDDGIPEVGYGVEPAGASMAVQFRSFVADTLQGVYLLFNHTLDNLNETFFDIVVWKDNYGEPGTEVFRMSNQYVDWSDSPFGFVYYPFTGSKPLLVGTFYVGIEQQSDGLINIGFDTSNDNQQYNFVNFDGTWQNSAFAGTIMLRPVMGKHFYTSVNEEYMPDLTIYPNPARDVIHIEGLTNGFIRVFDVLGRVVYQSKYNETLSVSNFSEGVYLLVVEDVTGKSLTKKIVISRS